MGYYSEVKIVMKDNDFKEMKARIDYYKNKEELKRFFKLSKEKFHFIDGKWLAVSYWDWVKWNPAYNKEVRYIEDYLRELHEQGKPFKMVRIGEDVGDIEILDSYGIDGDDCCDIIRPHICSEIAEDF